MMTLVLWYSPGSQDHYYVVSVLSPPGHSLVWMRVQPGGLDPGAASLLLPSTVLLPVEPITCIYVKKIAMCILFSTACDFKSLLFMS